MFCLSWLYGDSSWTPDHWSTSGLNILFLCSGPQRSIPFVPHSAHLCWVTMTSSFLSLKDTVSYSANDVYMSYSLIFVFKMAWVWSTTGSAASFFTWWSQWRIIVRIQSRSVERSETGSTSSSSMDILWAFQKLCWGQNVNKVGHISFHILSPLHAIVFLRILFNQYSDPNHLCCLSIPQRHYLWRLLYCLVFFFTADPNLL